MLTKTNSNYSEYKLENNNLFALYQQNPDLRTRNRILELNLGLVKKEVSHWMNQCQENYEDLLQVGSIGLIKAIEKFDLSKNCAFSTFALIQIRGEIQHYLRDRSNSMRIPRHCLELKSQANKLTAELRNKLNRQPTDREIAQKLGISLPEWQDVKLANQNRKPISLDTSIQDQGNKDSLGDLIPDQKYETFQLVEEDRIRLQSALYKLEESTRKAIEFVFLEDLTRKETADKLNVSVVTVSRYIKKGLASMKSHIMTEDFD